MAANSDPIYSRSSAFNGSPLIVTAASVVYDISGTVGTDIYQLWVSDATNGGFVQRVRFKYAANATTTSNTAVLRLWICSANAALVVGTNSWFYDDIALPATGALATTTVSPTYEIPLGFALPPTYYLMGKITVSQTASTGWLATIVAGKY